MSRSTKFIATFALLFGLAVVLGAGAKLVAFATAAAQPDAPLRQEFYEVKAHEHPMAIARALESQGVISSARLFYWYARLTGRTRKFKAGDYRFNNHMSPSEVLAVILSGISYGEPLTVPEGYNMAQVAEVIEKLRPGSRGRFLELCSDAKFIAGLGFDPPPASLEGYLYPETYLVGRKTPVEDLVRNMVKKFRASFTPEMQARAKELGLTEHQLVTLASIVEKETGAPEDRFKISSVFHNRLKKHMKLQSDPTVIYGIKDYAGKIHKRDLETPTPYNTYTIPGLPPGPISNPGRDAIEATLHPADTQYLFFVSHNDGTSEFTTNLADHEKAVEKYQLDPKAREGKSWRDLKQHKSASSNPDPAQAQ